MERPTRIARLRLGRKEEKNDQHEFTQRWLERKKIVFTLRYKSPRASSQILRLALITNHSELLRC